jgi:Fe2+ transport system protein FeoA
MILTELPLNQIATLQNFLDLDNSVQHQFLDSGLFPGREIKLIMKNQNQNKVIIDVGGIFLSIRFDTANQILVL